MTRRYAVELHAPGDPVELRREPKNPADPNAIAVFSLVGVQMGYIPAERAPFIGMMMSRGAVTAVFQGQSEHGAWLRIAFGDDEPVLPPERPMLNIDLSSPSEGKDADPEWTPDEEGPEFGA